MSLPRSIITVLAHFEPLFTTPTWKKGMVLLEGTLLARGRRTVTTALRQMGLGDGYAFQWMRIKCLTALAGHLLR